MDKIWSYVLSATIYGSITGITILIIKNLIKNKINKKYAYLLWMILIIKLIIPFGPESKLSLFNTIPIKVNNTINSTVDKNSNINNIDFEANYKTKEINSIDLSGYTTSSELGQSTHDEIDMNILKKTIPIIWILVFLMFITYHTIVYIYFLRDIRKNSKDANLYLQRILKDCKEKLHIKKKIQVRIVDMINSPSLIGIFKIKILIPRNLINLNEEELQHIFLHELFHYKSKDTWIDNLLVLLQSIHWFNPLIYYFFKQIRNDMEMACDERVLSSLDEKDHNKYGLTMLTILENMNFSKGSSIGLNMTDDKKTIKKRVELIKSAKKLSNKKKAFTITGIVCLLILGGLLLTNEKILVDDIYNSSNGLNDETLEKSISNAIIEKHANGFFIFGTDLYSDSEFITESHVILGKEEDEDSVEVYLMATYGRYEFENNIFNLISGSSNIPIRIKFSKVKEGEFLLTEAGYYYLDSEEAEDGSNYIPSIKRMFPKSIANKALNTDYTDILNKEMHNKAVAYVKSIGRDSEVAYDYVEKEYIDDIALKNIFNTEEISNYPEWIGTREQIEEEKRYIYETGYDKSSGIVTFTKYDEKKNIIEKMEYIIDGDKFEKINLK